VDLVNPVEEVNQAQKVN